MNTCIASLKNTDSNEWVKCLNEATELDAKIFGMKNKYLFCKRCAELRVDISLQDNSMIIPPGISISEAFDKVNEIFKLINSRLNYLEMKIKECLDMTIK